MFSVGSVCVKIAGRDAGSVCVVIEVLDNNYVLVDGLLRRKKVNTKHLERLNKVVSVKKSSSTSDVLEILKGVELVSEEQVTKWLGRKSKTVSEKPVTKRVLKLAKNADKKAKKAEEKKAKTNEKKAKAEEKKAKEAKKEAKKKPVKKTAAKKTEKKASKK